MASLKWKRTVDQSDQGQLMPLPSTHLNHRSINPSMYNSLSKPSMKWIKCDPNSPEQAIGLATERPTAILDANAVNLDHATKTNLLDRKISSESSPVDTSDSIYRDSTDRSQPSIFKDDTSSSDLPQARDDKYKKTGLKSSQNELNDVSFSKVEGRDRADASLNTHSKIFNKMKWKRDQREDIPVGSKLNECVYSMAHYQKQSMALQKQKQTSDRPKTDVSANNNLILNNSSVSSKKWSKRSAVRPFPLPNPPSSMLEDKAMSYQRPLVKRIRLMDNHPRAKSNDNARSENDPNEFPNDTSGDHVENLGTSKGMTDFAYRETSRVKPSSSKHKASSKILKSAARRNMGLVRVKPLQDQTPICPSFLEGKICENELCTFRHDVPTAAAMPLCSFFQRNGQCLKMDTCPFRHVKVRPEAPMCTSFQRLGYCENPNCTKKHMRTTRTHSNEKGTDSL